MTAKAFTVFPVNTSVVESAPHPSAADSATKASEARKESRASAQAPASMTLTGCLELDDDTFRLTDTTGENAPKSRSWKSGFLRRTNTKIDVIDAANGLRLPTHVGHRVSVTGPVVDRQMQASSLRMIATSCDGMDSSRFFPRQNLP